VRGDDAGRSGDVARIGVLRAYATRHGQGPFPSESELLTQLLRDSHNVDTGWQGRFRAGWFDVPLTRYALSVCPGISQLAVTCLDRLAEVPEWSFCQEYSASADYEPATTLQAKPSGDLVYQEKLTQDLLHCDPVLQKVPSDVESYVKKIEAATNLPVAITSHGRTAESKRWA
jgi:adenylosuccinate synthase